MGQFDERAPVLVGVGEASRPDIGGEWPNPVELAATAALRALADSGRAGALAGAIDLLLAIRTFVDSRMPLEFGGPENVPEAIAAAAGLSPARLVYGDVGGQSPQRHINRLAAMIHAGEIRAALIAGGEAVATIKRARQAGRELDWRRPARRDREDWLTEERVLTTHEIRHGIASMPLAYSLVENARRARLGQRRAAYMRDMAALWSALSPVSLGRDHARFARDIGPEALIQPEGDNYRLTDPYMRWMVAQDAVDLGAAAILTSAGEARRLGIARERLVHLVAHGDADEPLLSRRRDPSFSHALKRAAGRALEAAAIPAGALGPLDIYSCFPCAVSIGIEALGLTERPLESCTLTGTLAFFGGPGNNYSLHAIAAMVDALRADGERPAMITANGGVLAKQSVGIYSANPPERPWAPDACADIMQDPADDLGPPLHPADGDGEIETYTMPFSRGEAGPASLFVRTGGGRALALLADPPVGRDLIGARVKLRSDEKRNHAELIG